ncbi:hypothetical protein DDZ14_11350 [Maritimibacter sp. 55A14]|nr:hypothetical protein DDZ14_11350 [Maritimibacter sp. 55A14]
MFAIPVLLAACAEPKWASTKDVQAAMYRHPGPSTIALMTMIRTSTGTGGHSALLINGTQRVIFDPAGTWWHRNVPERNDVLYGIRPIMLDFYLDYHSRTTYHTVVQTVEVAPEVAQQAISVVEAYGAVPKMQCSLSVTRILAQLPGFESVGGYWHPHKTMADFAKLPGVTTYKVFDTDADDNHRLPGNQVAAAN